MIAFSGAFVFHTEMIHRLVFLALFFVGVRVCGGVDDPAAQGPEDWRAEKRLIDLHLHINYTPDHLKRAVKIMDAAGIGIGVNLSGGTVTSKDGGPSAFERNKKLADELAPGRFVHSMNLDYSGWDEPDFGERAAARPLRISVRLTSSSPRSGLSM